MHTKTYLTILLFALGLNFTSTGYGQIEEGGFQHWNPISITYEIGDQEPEPAEELQIERVHSIVEPTVFDLPPLGEESALMGEVVVVEGDAELYIWQDEAWQPFSGSLELGPGTPPLIGAVPNGKATLAFQLNISWPCYRYWLCSNPTSTPIGAVRQSCTYTCSFKFDLPSGCSGLGPGATKKYTNVQLGFCFPYRLHWD